MEFLQGRRVWGVRLLANQPDVPVILTQDRTRHGLALRLAAAFGFVIYKAPSATADRSRLTGVPESTAISNGIAPSRTRTGSNPNELNAE